MTGLQRIRLSRRGEPTWSMYTACQLAKVLHVSRPTYYKLEKDPSLLTEEQASTLADYLGCEVSDFFAAGSKRRLHERG